MYTAACTLLSSLHCYGTHITKERSFVIITYLYTNVITLKDSSSFCKMISLRISSPILHSSFSVTRQHITFSVWQSFLELSGFEDNFCSVSNMTLNTYFFKLQSHTVPQTLRKKTTALFHVVFGLKFWTLKS